MEQSSCKLHPMVLFWLGVLTGALIVGIIFLYGNYQSQNLQGRLLQGGKTVDTSTSIQGPGF